MSPVPVRVTVIKGVVVVFPTFTLKLVRALLSLLFETIKVGV